MSTTKENVKLGMDKAQNNKPESNMQKHQKACLSGEDAKPKKPKTKKKKSS